jgi:hypothetical protein
LEILNAQRLAAGIPARPALADGGA